ncbi:MAG: sugar ABC transporter substrate-binding protein [Clostridia bacterium]
MKKLLTLAVAVLLALSIAAPAFAEVAPNGIRVGFANINEKGSFGKMVLQNMKKTAAERGYELICVDNNSDGATAVANADTLLAMDIDYMIEYNVDQSVAPVIMEKFTGANIPVVAIDIEHEGAIYFGADNARAGTVAGETAGQWIKDNWDGAVDYVVLIIQPVSGAAVAPRVQMFPTGLRNAGIVFDDAQIVQIDGQNDAQYTQARFADFLLAHPDAKKVAVATINDVAGSGVYAAAETANRQNDIVLVSQNATADFVEPMYAVEGKTNWIASVAYFPNRYGEFVFNIIDKMVAGEQMDERYYIDHLAITWDNIDEWYPLDNLPWAGL